MAVKVVKKDGRVFFIGKAVARDTKVVVNDHLMYEDDFNGLYWTAKNPNNLLIQPPYNPATLFSLITRNNVLAQCVSVMETNIDGTGWTIEPEEKGEDGKAKGNEADKQKLEEFFKQTYPGESFLTLRRKLRKDLEATGNAYMEVIRNVQNEIVFLRHVDATLIRLVRLDDAVQVTKEIMRGNEKIPAMVWVRERRYAQKVGQKLLYFREFGASRQLDRDDGKWATGQLPPDKAATELIHLTAENDVKTPYGIPRWINQLPSTLGSRKAEEFNLEFFDNGGVPPAMVFIQGGALANDVKQQVDGYLQGGAKGKHRVAVVEVQSTSGSIDSPGSVQVKVERFGDARQGDSMFQQYDKNCEEHVRVGFRLPPLFLGRAQDYNFATAMTAYMVTEAQVFAPERKEFDEIVNAKIIKSLGVQGWKLASQQLTLKDVTTSLTALGMVKDMIDPEKLVKTVNELTGMNLEYDETAHETANQIKGGIFGQPTDENGKLLPPPPKPDVGKPGTPPKAQARQQTPGRAAVKKSALDLIALVRKWTVAVNLDEGEMSADERREVVAKVEALDGEELDLFNHMLASTSFSRAAVDPEGMAEIAGACRHVVATVVKEDAPTVVAPDLGPVVEKMSEMVAQAGAQHRETLAVVGKTVDTALKRPIEVTVKMVKDKKPVVRKATFPDGRVVTLSEEVRER